MIHTISKRSADDSSPLKWNYNLGDEDMPDYFNSLAPEIGESQLHYRQRLFKEYSEISAILYLIESDRSIYFKNTCINYGSEFERCNLHCPSCGMKKKVASLAALLSKVRVEREVFYEQFKEFSRAAKGFSNNNGGDIGLADKGIVQCLEYFNYFHYLTHNFIKTRKYPHFGRHFDFKAPIFQDEWDYLGLSHEEYDEQFL